MYQLVIAEKPSVAQSLAAVLGAGQRREGYLEGNGWLVSWCVGHLAELADAAAYNPAYAKWRKEDLPILPESWRFTIAKDKRDQFDVLRTLLRREDVSEVVNACDAGREGELIFRTVYALAGCSKPISRLWISSMEDEAIREGFAHLRPGREYDGLHQAALCRSKADWLVGINATRLFSLLYGCTLNIGRVVSPTLALVVQREAEIATFQPEPFYMVELDCDGLSLAGDRKASKKEAQEAAARCQGSAAVVQSVERWEKTEKPPALFDLTTLQREANRTLGYTAQQTLDYLQALYDKKLSTYPRTDSRYLTDDMEAGVPALVEAAASICGVTAPETVLAGQVCDSARVSDHHAVVPTASAGKADLEALPIGEREILRLVSLGLLRAVCPLPLCGDLHHGGMRRRPLYRQVEVGSVPRLEGIRADGRRGGWERAGWTDGRADAAGGRRPGQVRQDHAAQAPHRGLPALRHGDGGQGGYAGRCREAGHWHTGHPRRYSGKTGVRWFCGAEKGKENRLSPAHPPGHGAHHGAAGAVTVSHADRRVGAPAERGRARDTGPRRFHGRDRRHAAGTGGDLPPGRGQRGSVPLHPRGGGPLPTVRRDRHRGQAGLFL